VACSLTSQLYKAARLSATGRAIRTGKPASRAKKVLIGRTLGDLYEEPEPTVAEGTVSRDAIIAYLAELGEHEVVALPEDVTIVHTAPV